MKSFDSNLKYLPCGDNHLLINLGDTIDLEYNFKAILLKENILKHQIIFVKDIIVGTCSLLIQFDNTLIDIEKLAEIISELEKFVDYEKPIFSRIIKIPILFNDKWTKECALSQNLDPDFDFILKYNKLNSEKFIEIFTSAQYWVKYVGFSPGLIAFNAIDQTKSLSATQLPSPRTWTPKGALGIGYSGNCIYANRTPGGIRLAGITPVLTYDIKTQNKVFKGNPVLFRAGDRLITYSINEREFFNIRDNISDYNYEIIDSTYSLKQLKGKQCSKY